LLTSHNRTDLSQCPETSQRPSVLRLAEEMSLASSWRVSTHFPLLTSHNRMNPSQPPETCQDLSSFSFTEVTLSFPRKAMRQCPLAACFIEIHLSVCPWKEISQRPFVSKFTETIS